MGRTDRNRLDVVRDEIDFRNRPGNITTPRILAQVFDGGAIPTTVPRVFLTHPVVVDADDTEGAGSTFTANTSVTCSVVVLGPKVPVAGDYIVAHAIGGRWVSGQGGAHPLLCSLYYCEACGEYLLIDQGTVTDLNGSHAFDLTGTTAPIGVDGYWYVLDCLTHAPNVALEEHWIDPDTGDEQFEGDIAAPSSCDPLTSSHTFASTGVPATSATVSVPKAAGKTCSPCCIPGEADGPLSLTLSGGSVGNGTYAMNFGAFATGVISDPAWGSAVIAINGVVVFGCDGSGNLGISTGSSNFGSVDCLTGVIADFTCDPFHIHFTRTPASCTDYYWTDLTIDGP